MEDKERTLTEAEVDEPECKSEQKPEPRTEKILNKMQSLSLRKIPKMNLSLL